ncbi:glycoside hydrolase [Pseudomonas aeruginosa]|uniref:glycoside hydrolase n=1 Tax=Pseudomonas aeruginosa TaxID=287 RepID=UPI0038968BCF
MHLAHSITAVFVFLFIIPSAHASVELKNDEWTVTLVPETLAIAIQPSNEERLELSSGVTPQVVTGLKKVNNCATWKWNGDAYTILASLKGRDLSLSITAKKAGRLSILSQPASALGKGLVFPLAEGFYISSHNKIWHDFLLERLETFNTSQDISLPLWGLDHENFSLTWIFTNPFNNTANFVRDNDSLSLTLEHDFTTLNYKTPMTFLLHLGENEPLAGAKRYREWLITEGNYKTLTEKIAITPEAGKLIGATHAYLWGSGLIGIEDVKDWAKFIEILKTESKLTNNIRKRFESEPTATLKQIKRAPSEYQKTVITRAFNLAMDALARESWQTTKPDMYSLSHSYAELRKEVATKFYGVLEPDSSHWGGGISIATMETLKEAGLQRMWIGLGEGWEGGLWHPEAIKSGVDAGYLVAPYDSYETALQKGDNPSWATAHLGKAVYHDCAIKQKDGTIKAGFNKSGRYTQPDCIRPVMESRISSILSMAPFNSWFLDAYATGMVFDSYPPAKPITQAQYAAGNEYNMRWVGEKLKLPIGSEDGNATTAQGVLFAHGMQTPVIGWGDIDMQQDSFSPYFLGRWYPSEKPETFFKEVPIKEPYKTIYFDPRTRLPLYQAVFHGSIITTHHWLFDSLKLTNVRTQNELLQLLYNVAPLYHLSADTVLTRLPFIKRHDAFFRPLHERLATQKLIDFRWLTADRLIQQTTYEDGTMLIANFKKEKFQHGKIELNGQSIAAYPADQGDPTLYQSQFLSELR